MGPEIMSDFRVSTNGQCFFCLKQIKTRTPGTNLPSSPATQTSSLQYFTRYLKMDLKKVFLDEGQVSPELLTKIERARLKVELCEECRCLSERFSKVYRHLEKLEMELGSILRLIHEKLAGEDATDQLRGLSPNLNGLLEVLDILRAEATQKSSRKLTGTPRVTIKRLSKKKIQLNQSRLKNDFRSTNHNQATSQLETSSGLSSEFGLETSDVKMESLNDEGLSDNDNGNYLSDDDVDFNTVSGRSEHNEETTLENIKVKLNADDKIVTGQAVVAVHAKVVSRTGTTRQKLGIRNCSINSETGKRKCNDCQLEFNNYQTFDYHYRTVHLKLRYKCVSCNKLFSLNSNLRLHQRTSRSCSITESASKFNCHLCQKSYPLKQTLQRHLDGVHYKLLKYECDLCEKKYNTYNSLNDHRKRVHRGESKR